MTPEPADPDEQLERELELRIDRLRFLSDELRVVRHELDLSRRTTDRVRGQAIAAQAELRRLRRHPVVRTLQRVSRTARRVAAVLRRRPDAAAQGDVVADGVTQAAAEPGQPASPARSRSALRARVLPGADVGLRLGLLWPAEVDPALPSSEAVGAAIRGVGWEIAAADAQPDAVLFFDPAADVRAVPDGTLRLGWVSTPARAAAWLDSEWFDELDLVFVPPEARDAVARESVHLPVAVDASDPDLGPALRDAVVAWLDTAHVDIAIGPRDWDAALVWGDYYFARSLQRAFIRRGVAARLRLRDAWDADAAADADAVVHLFGMTRREVRTDQVNVLWVISHPDLVTDDMLREHDLVFAASDRLAEALAARSGREVVALHQATDPDRFHPTPGGPAHDLLFVAGYRSTRRPVVDELTPTPLGLAVYGRGWTTDVLDARHHAGDYVPNRRLAAYYSAAKIVLNDHWADMAEWGVFSNRLYDAAASGAFILSDHVDGIEDEFDGGVATFRSGAELRRLVRRYLAAPEERGAMARRAMAAVVARHTFDRRAEVLLGALEPLVRDRRRTAERGDG